MGFQYIQLMHKQCGNRFRSCCWSEDDGQLAVIVLLNHLDENVWSAARLQEKVEGEKASLRKCIRPVMEISSPGHDELRACLSL